MKKEQDRYLCVNHEVDGIITADHPIWREIKSLSLVDVVSGAEPLFPTGFQMFRSDRNKEFYVLFTAKDDEIRSCFRLHDEPIYRSDVFEMFIADENNLQHYKELEVSPYDVRFDGLIHFPENSKPELDMSWDIQNWKTKTTHHPGLQTTMSLWVLPYDAFAALPEKGKSWRFNAFRVDHSERGIDLQAWRKTGEPNFHVPACFGFLDFV